MPPTMRLGSDWVSWAYALVAVPLVLLLVEVLRGAVHEVTSARTQTFLSELQRLQSRAENGAKGLEVLVQSHNASGVPWAEIREHPWCARYWSDTKPGSHDLYAAV